MALDDSKADAWREMQELNGRARAERDRLNELPLHGGGGGGTSGGMEARVAALEAHMEHVRKDIGKLADVPADLATLKADTSTLKAEVGKLAGVVGALDVLKNDVSKLPTKEYLGDKLGTYLTRFGIIMTVTFGAIAAAFKFLVP